MPNDSWYEGRDLDAEWRESAWERIENHRKADLTVEVRDAEGDSVEGADVRVEQTDHAFGFGTVVDGSLLLGRDDEYDEATKRQYRETFIEYFNRGTVNDGFYPFQWGDPDEKRHELGMATAEWLNGQGYTVHGHTVLWNDEDHTLPDLVGMEDPEAIRERLREHVREQVDALEGDIHEWDIINHPLAMNDIWMDHLDSNREDWIDWLETAREADPEATLFINEEAMRDQPTVRETDEKYREMVEYLVENDAALDGAGFMGHFTPNTLLSPTEVIEWLDRYEEYGIELQITEFDIAAGWHAEDVDGELPDVPDAEWRDVQSDYLRDFLTAVFSHPSSTAFIIWGFWEPEMWRPDGAFLTEAFERTPLGRTYIDLVFNEWWTETSGVTDDSGRATFDGFLGEYEIEAEAGGQTWRTTARLAGDGSKVMLGGE